MKIIFMGTPYLAAETLKKLIKSGHEVIAVVTQPDKPSGRGMTTKFSPVKEVAAGAGIKVLQPESVRIPEALDELEAQGADLFVVTAYAQLLPERLLNMAPFGCINLHPSLLPKYRGAAPLRGPILNGDPVTGVTIMKMAPQLDAGDIFLQEEFTMDPKETVRSLTQKVIEKGADMLIRVIDCLEAGTAVCRMQNESEASYIKQLEKEDGRICFMNPAEKIERQIRACDPWPSAFTLLGGKTFKIWDADVAENIPGQEEKDVPAGGVVYADKQSLLIRCGEGYLKLNEVQMEGKKRMGVEEFLRGKKIEQGFIFG